MLLNCGVGEDSWESLGLQGNRTSPSYRKSVLNIHGTDWCLGWSSNTLATWCEELTYLKRPWCWERLKAGGEGDDRGWDGWVASLTQWRWVWVDSRSWWCHPTILSSVIPFASCPQSSLASWSFPTSQLFTSGNQSIGASASVLPMNIQDRFPLGWTGWISLQSKGLSRVFSHTTVQKHQFFGAQLYLWPNSHIHTWLLEKTIGLTRQPSILGLPLWFSW